VFIYYNCLCVENIELYGYTKIDDILLYGYILKATFVVFSYYTDNFYNSNVVKPEPVPPPTA
jgi:hypothetical protein